MNREDFFTGFCLLIISFVLGIWIGVYMSNSDWEKKVIDGGAAEWSIDIKTGERQLIIKKQ